jgi:hypothetical protein
MGEGGAYLQVQSEAEAGSFWVARVRGVRSRTRRASSGATSTSRGRRQLNNHSDARLVARGGVPERSKGRDCKFRGSAFAGSNPAPAISHPIRTGRDREALARTPIRLVCRKVKPKSTVIPEVASGVVFERTSHGPATRRTPNPPRNRAVARVRSAALVRAVGATHLAGGGAEEVDVRAVGSAHSHRAQAARRGSGAGARGGRAGHERSGSMASEVVPSVRGVAGIALPRATGVATGRIHRHGFTQRVDGERAGCPSCTAPAGELCRTPGGWACGRTARGAAACPGRPSCGLSMGEPIGLGAIQKGWDAIGGASLMLHEPTFGLPLSVLRRLAAPGAITASRTRPSSCAATPSSSWRWPSG